MPCEHITIMHVRARATLVVRLGNEPATHVITVTGFIYNSNTLSTAQHAAMPIDVPQAPVS